MITNFYLICNSRGTVKVNNKVRPSLAPDEVAIEMKLQLPDSLFKKPQLTAQILVTDEMARPQVITPEVQDSIKTAIEGVSGMSVILTYNGIEGND